MDKYYNVLFESNEKSYVFRSSDEIATNEKVIVDTEKGLQLGIVAAITKKRFDNTKDIIRIANPKDIEQYEKNLKDAKSAEKECQKFIKELNLDMELISTSYSLDRETLLFTYISKERVDFRDLLKKLSYKFRTRIELFQLGARDRAKEVGGLGLCGQKLCCAKFLNENCSVSITSAKNQEIALNPNKINGLCNHLLCCLNYENETYTELKKDLPKVGSKIKCKNKQCEVISNNILKETYTIKCNDEFIELKKGKK